MFKTNVSIIHGSIRTPERSLVKLNICHSKWYHKICNQTFSYRFIVAAILDEKSNIFWCNPFLYTFLYWLQVTIEGLLETQFACEIQKFVSDGNMRCSSLNAKTTGVSLMSSCLHNRMRK